MASLSEVVELFESKIGHEPKNIKQLFNFCKMENLSIKYSVLNKWCNGGKNMTCKTQARIKSVGKYQLLNDQHNFLKLLKQEIESFRIILSKYIGHKDNNTIKQSIDKYKLFLIKLSLDPYT